MANVQKPPRRPVRKRRHPLSHIKTGCTYDVVEAAALLGVHRNTVRQWLKVGLKPIDDKRPLLIHGAELKAFLARRQDDRRTRCGPGEFFCFRCKTPRKPWGGLVDTFDHGPKIVRLGALCECCETIMHRTVTRSKLNGFLEAAAPVKPALIGEPMEGERVVAGKGGDEKSGSV
jgi:hypothetical protein